MRKHINKVIAGIVFIVTAGFALMTCRDEVSFTIKKKIGNSHIFPSL